MSTKKDLKRLDGVLGPALFSTSVKEPRGDDIRGQSPEELAVERDNRPCILIVTGNVLYYRIRNECVRKAQFYFTDTVTHHTKTLSGRCSESTPVITHYHYTGLSSL